MGKWTQAICDSCWEKRNPDRQAHRLVEADLEVCSYCGDITTSGLYVRDDPKTVPYPRYAPSTEDYKGN